MKLEILGKENYQVGKTLWEILGNLKDCGVGRLITRSMYKRYPEPSFFKVVKVEALPAVFDNPPYNYRKCICWVERTFRGERYSRLIELSSSTYKPDYLLIPKDEEQSYIRRAAEVTKEIRIYDDKVDLPPLLKMILTQEKKAKGEDVDDLQMPVAIWMKMHNKSRLVKPGEKPTHRIPYGLGTPALPDLYANIEQARPFYATKDSFDKEIGEGYEYKPASNSD